MSSRLSRRDLLGAGALGLAVAGLGGLTSCGRVEDPDGILARTRGFSCTLLARSGETPTSDGSHPSDPDGMGDFDRPGGGSILVCNHENDGAEPHAVPTVDGLTYDPGASGGTSTLVVDAEGRRVSQPTSLAGTVNNCAGGVPPGAHG